MGESFALGRILWWGSWLAWPLLASLLWRARRWRRLGAGQRLLLVVLVLAGLAFVEARFVEPRRLVVRETSIDVGAQARVALVSDLHLGLYKDQAFMATAVERLNALPLDAVLIAGDFHGEFDGRPLAELLQPLKQLKHPAYAVPGNHDDGIVAGQPLGPALDAALRAVGVQPIQQRDVPVGGVRVVGMGDRWSGQDLIAPVLAAPHDRPVLVLMHNPDSAMQLQPGMAALALAGHTHGGQLRIPGLYRRIIPCVFPFDRGLHTFAPVPVFVTSGLGETAVPLRWMNPPVIDVLQLH